MKRISVKFGIGIRACSSFFASKSKTAKLEADQKPFLHGSPYHRSVMRRKENRKAAGKFWETPEGIECLKKSPDAPIQKL